MRGLAAAALFYLSTAAFAGGAAAPEEPSISSGTAFPESTQITIIPDSLIRQALNAKESELTPLDEARKAFERDYLVRILKITGGNVSKAARLAGRNRTEFYRLLERHALEPSVFKVA